MATSETDHAMSTDWAAILTPNPRSNQAVPQGHNPSTEQSGNEASQDSIMEDAPNLRAAEAIAVEDHLSEVAANAQLTAEQRATLRSQIVGLATTLSDTRQGLIDQNARLTSQINDSSTRMTSQVNELAHRVTALRDMATSIPDDHLTHSDDSGADEDYDEDYDEGDEGDSLDGEEIDPNGRILGFYPLHEDASVPDELELKAISNMPEPDATDDDHFTKKTFFDPKDPEIIPGESGMIVWDLDKVYGTNEQPCLERVMFSETVLIGGYKWRIKLFPHGSANTDRLSVFVENLDIAGRPDIDWPTLPFPAFHDPELTDDPDAHTKEPTVAAQIAIVIYNPKEPRVNVFHHDAHQFSTLNPDHGWPRFTSVPWYELHRRSYRQRVPLSQNDKLSIKAYIRIVQDPTRSLWRHEKPFPAIVVRRTGLAPLGDKGLVLSTLTFLLHYRPLRDAVMQLYTAPVGAHAKFFGAMFHCQLLHMRTREPEVLDYDVRLLRQGMQELGMPDYQSFQHSDVLSALDMIFGNAILCGQLNAQYLAPERRIRLPATQKSSIQKLIKASVQQPTTPEGMQVFELQRQVFDTSKRCWKKMFKKITMDDQIVIGETSYTLFALITHKGNLRSGQYRTYFRPGGLDALWYSYNGWDVDCLTRKQAVTAHEGSGGVLESRLGRDGVSMSNAAQAKLEIEPVAYVAFYVRDDVGTTAFDMSVQEKLVFPKWVQDVSAKKPHETIFTPEEIAASVAPGREARTDGDVTMTDNLDKKRQLKKVSRTYFSQPSHVGTIDPKTNLYHGHGKHISLSGDSYSGFFDAGLRQGYGTMIYGNGDTYSGTWAADMHEGEGTFTEHVTGNKYIGQWKEGKKYGKGVTHWEVSEEEKGLCRICYAGRADTAFSECGHLVACYTCAAQLRECPVCRKRVRGVLRIFPVGD